MDSSLVEFSVQLVHDLADKYNFSNRGNTFATHDVPGITRAAIPIFKKMGINAINIGVDRASAVPATGPVCYNSSGGFAYTNDCADFQSTGRPAFVWRDVPSGEEIITMVNPYGYANMEDGWLEHWLNSTVTVPCSSHALALNWRHDNDGPAGLEEVLDIYAHLRKEFPGAKIIASTLDAFAVGALLSTQQICTALQHDGPNHLGLWLIRRRWKRRRSVCRCGTPTTWTVLQQDGPNRLGLWYNVLPEHQMALITSFLCALQVVESEMGDTWSHGPPSDPLKVSMFRTLTRARRRCLDEGRCSTGDHRFYNFSRLLLKNAEHDWGRSGGAMGSDQSTGWSNAEFHAKLAVETTPASGWNSTNDCRPTTNSGPCHMQDMIDSYVEERNWGIYYAHEALFDHPLRVEVSAALEELQPRRPDISAGNWQQVADLATRFDLGRWSIGFNQTTGAINHLVDTKASGRVWADQSHQLAEYTYQTYTWYDHNVVFMNEYMSEALYNPTMGASLNGVCIAPIAPMPPPPSGLCAIPRQPRWHGAQVGVHRPSPGFWQAWPERHGASGPPRVVARTLDGAQLQLQQQQQLRAWALPSVRAASGHVRPRPHDVRCTARALDGR